MQKAPVATHLDSSTLIAMAHGWRYLDFGESALQTFRSQLLIPTPTPTSRPGTSPIYLYPSYTDRQLRSLLYWRTLTRNHDVLRVLLWADGYNIDPDAVLSSLPRYLDDVQRSASRMLEWGSKFGTLTHLKTLEALASKALRNRRYPMLQPDSIPLGQRVVAVTSLMRMFLLGEPPLESTDRHAALIESFVCLGDRARRDTINGEGPWLTGPATDLFPVARLLSLPALLNAARTATQDELEAARPGVVALFQNMPFFARVACATLGRSNPFGFGVLRRIDVNPLVAPWLVTALIALRRHGYGSNIDTLVEALSEAPALMAQTRELHNMDHEEVHRNIARSPLRNRPRLRRMHAAIANGAVLPAKPASPSQAIHTA